MYFPRVWENWKFSEFELVSDSADSSVRVGVDVFPRFSELTFGWNLIPAEFWSVVCSSGLIVEFCLWFFRCDQVAREAS